MMRDAMAGSRTASMADRVVDFLLDRLDDAQLAAVLRRLGPRRAAAAPDCGPPRTRIACLGARSIKLIPLSDVEYVKSSLAGVHAVTPAGEFYTEHTLAALEAAPSLVRCHKQYLVNVDRIDEVDLSCLAAASIRTRSGFCVPVGRRFRRRLRSALQF